MQARRLRNALMGVLLTTALATPASAQNIENYHHPVTGVAEAWVSSCTWEDHPAGTLCVDTLVHLSQSAFGKEPATKQPWYLFVGEEHWLALGGDEWERVAQRYGELLDANGRVDKVHMLSASVDDTLTMSDGSRYDIDLSWDMSGQPVNTDGKDGPVVWPAPDGGHHVDRCTTENWLAHQRYRWGGDGLGGTLDGVDASTLISYPEGYPYVSGRSDFKIVRTKHGPNC